MLTRLEHHNTSVREKLIEICKQQAEYAFTWRVWGRFSFPIQRPVRLQVLVVIQDTLVESV